MSPVPNYSTTYAPARPPSPTTPPPCIMTTFEPWAANDSPNAEHRSATTAVLSAHLETLNAFKDMVEAVPVKAVFESVIVILTLVRVRFPVLFPFSHLLINGTTRTKWQRKIRLWNWPMFVLEHATC